MIVILLASIFAESDLPTLSFSTLVYQTITDHLRYCLLHRQLSTSSELELCTRMYRYIAITSSESTQPRSQTPFQGGVGV